MNLGKRALIIVCCLAVASPLALPAADDIQLRPWDEYRVIMWCGDSASKLPPEKYPLFLQRLRKMGVNTGMIHHDGDPKPWADAKFPYYVENIINRGLCLKWNSKVRDWDKMVQEWRKTRTKDAFVVFPYSPAMTQGELTVLCASFFASGVPGIFDRRGKFGEGRHGLQNDLTTGLHNKDGMYWGRNFFVDNRNWQPLEIPKIETPDDAAKPEPMPKSIEGIPTEDLESYLLERTRADSPLKLARWVEERLPKIPREVSVPLRARVLVRRYNLRSCPRELVELQPVGSEAKQKPRLVSFERNINWQMSEDFKQKGGNEALEKPIELEAKFAKPAHVYDLRAQKYLGETDRINFTLDPWQPSLFALLPEKLPAETVIETLLKE